MKMSIFLGQTSLLATVYYLMICDQHRIYCQHSRYFHIYFSWIMDYRVIKNFNSIKNCNSALNFLLLSFFEFSFSALYEILFLSAHQTISGHL